MEVFDSEGRVRLEYCDVISSDRYGRAKGRIPFALNDPSGIWKLRVTETVSGKSKEVKMVLR